MSRPGRDLAVIEGWAGGPKLSKLFRQELIKQDFRITKDIKNANIVFAHSTGCYMLPKDLKSELIVLLDPPFWPNRSIVGRWLDLMKTDWSMLKSGNGANNFIAKKLWEIFYIFAKPSFTLSVIKNESKLEFLNNLKTKQVVLIRNTNDQFCSADIKAPISKYKNVKYLEIPGDHENYYTNPQLYIDLLLKEL